MKLLMFVLLCAFFLPTNSLAEAKYNIAKGDLIKVTVFQNPDLSLEVRVHESGNITYPLLGKVEVAGLALENVEAKISALLRTGGYVREPQVSVTLENPYGSQVAVLGHVNRPGRYPLMTADLKLTDMLAMAGGIQSEGADKVVVLGTRNGKSIRVEVDVPALFFAENPQNNLLIEAGDTIHVDQASVFYIYGEVQRPGSYRVGRNMTLMQALAVGGGLSERGSEKEIQIYRNGVKVDGEAESPTLESNIRSDDVIVVGESFF